MSAWQVYLLMQANSLSTAFCIIAVFSGIGFVVSLIARYASATDVNEQDIENRSSDWRTWQACVNINIWFCWLFFPMFVGALFMPNTKTVAAMIVLPKITSPAALDAIGAEGRELYGLAKDALKSLTHDSKPDDDKKYK